MTEYKKTKLFSGLTTHDAHRCVAIRKSHMHHEMENKKIPVSPFVVFFVPILRHPNPPKFSSVTLSVFLFYFCPQVSTRQVISEQRDTVSLIEVFSPLHITPEISLTGYSQCLRIRWLLCSCGNTHTHTRTRESMQALQSQTFLHPLVHLKVVFLSPIMNDIETSLSLGLFFLSKQYMHHIVGKGSTT